MKKKRAMRNYIILSILLLICFVFSFISFRIPSTVNNFAGFINGIYRGIDLNGGVTATYVVESKEGKYDEVSTAVDKAVDRVVTLLSDEYTEYYVEKVNEDKIRVTIPRLNDNTTIESKDIVNYITFTTSEVTDAETFEPLFTAEYITSASYFTSNGTFGTLIEFNDEGKEALLDMASGLSSDSTLYIYQDKEYSSVLLRMGVDSESLQTIAEAKQLFISDVSLFPTKDDAVRFADKIASGMLNIDMAIEGEILEVSPVYGELFATTVLIIIVALIIASFVYLVLKYGELAIATALSMLTFVALSVIIMPLIASIQMSLVGFVAFAVIYAIAYYCHINYLEKARQDFETGKKFVACFKSSYVKSVLCSTDILAVTFIVGLITALIAAGAVKTIALFIAILSLPAALTSMLIHRGLVKWYLDINPTKYKKVNFEKGVTANEE